MFRLISSNTEVVLLEKQILFHGRPGIDLVHVVVACKWFVAATKCKNSHGRHGERVTGSSARLNGTVAKASIWFYHYHCSTLQPSF